MAFHPCYLIKRNPSSKPVRRQADKSGSSDPKPCAKALDCSADAGRSTPYFKRILSLAWPTMMEQFLQTAVQYADTAMVGSLGTMAVAAVGTTSTINWLINGTLSGASIGFLALASRALGARDFALVKKISIQTVLAVLSFGLLFSGICLGFSSRIPVWMQADPSIVPTASRYFWILSLPLLFRCAAAFFGTLLRSVQDTKTPMEAGLFSNGINIVLNVFLIYDKIPLPFTNLVLPGAGMGVTGAAAASAIAFTFGGLFLTWKIWTHPLLSFRHQLLLPDWKLIARCSRISLPGITQRFATSMGYVFFASMINSTGPVSTAAHTIANTVESAFYIPGWGMQAAIAALCGYMLGSSQVSEMKDLKKSALKIELILMCLSGSLLFMGAPSFMRIFSSDPKVIRLGSTVLKMVALSEPIYGIPIILEGMMIGLGETIIPFWLNISGMWGIRIVGTWFCTQIFSMGLVAAWVCMIAHNVFLFIAFVLYDKLHPLQSLAYRTQTSSSARMDA